MRTAKGGAKVKIEKLLIGRDLSVLEAMRRLDETGRRILFVADENGLLQGVLTDGDVRRFILSGGKLEAPVAQAANFAPHCLPQSERWRAQAELQRRSIDAIPLLDDAGRIVDAVFAEHILAEQCEAIGLPVVMMAGGLGTRLYPYTKILPKPLIPIGEKPIAEHIIDNFRRFGCKEFHLVVNYRKNMIKSYFSELQEDYTILYQDEEEPLGTGGGLAFLKGQLHGTFILTNCDVLVRADFADIYHYHKKSGNVITMICAFQHTTIPYGVVELTHEGRIASMTEKPQMNYLTNTGVYLVEPCVVEQMQTGVPIGFPEVIEQWRQKANDTVGVYPVSENCWMDMGQVETLEDMRRRLESTH